MLKYIIPTFLLPAITLLAILLYVPKGGKKSQHDAVATGQSFEPAVVLQLFTSQGCSSCPPADALLNNLREEAGNKSLFCIAYHVDYWNYIGWEDPFSRSEYTDKQRKYGAKFGNGQIYTPQLVINGKEHFVGSDAAGIRPRIAAYSKKPSSNSLMLEAHRKSNGTLRLDYEVLGPLSHRNIRAVMVLNKRTTSVKRGENRDRVLVNTNIAVAEVSRPLNQSAGTISINIPSWIKANKSWHLVVVTETNDLDITGAAAVAVSDDNGYDE